MIVRCELLLSLLLVGEVTAWVGETASFRKRSKLTRSTVKRSNLFMDADTPIDSMNILSCKAVALHRTGRQGYKTSHNISVRRIEKSFGHSDMKSDDIPVNKCARAENGEEGQFFTPFWEKQMFFMRENLSNLRSVPVVSRKGQDMTYAESADGTVRMHTLLFTSEEYGRIRMTTFDAGNDTQIFTTVFYPHPSSNLPIFGANLMRFQKQRHICAVDFQPIHSKEGDHDCRYEHLLKPVRDLYPSLHGTLNPRVYDGTQFFSGQTLLGRSNANDITSQNMIFEDLLPAFQSYMETHVRLVRDTPRNIARIPIVRQKHREFELFFEEHDPTHAVLTKSFGKDFADDFLFDIHFPLIKNNK